MGTEIERKFLVHESAWDAAVKPTGVHILQGYLFNQGKKSCRVRITNDAAMLNIKFMVDALHRGEFEYPIPIADANILYETICETRIEKTRFLFPSGNFTWEVDVFEGANAGLVVAEIELSHADDTFEKPDWVAEEVTHDFRYLNTNLAEKPYSTWQG